MKACLKPSLNKAYLIMTTIEGKLASLQETRQKIKSVSAGLVIEQLVEEMKQVETQCTTEVVVIQVNLGGLRYKISAPAE